MLNIRPLLLVLACLGTNPVQAVPEAPLAVAANGTPILSPISKATVEVRDGATLVHVPSGMVFVPSGKFTFGTGVEAVERQLDAYCIGRYEVTNIEYKTFLDATQHRGIPRYWKNGMYPKDKANHPVLYVSYDDAVAYCSWVAKSTGWKAAVPTAEQWEKAARGPKAYLYPWGNDKGNQSDGDTFKARFNYNAVCAAHYLTTQPDLLTAYTQKSSLRGQPVKVSEITGSRGQRLAVGRDGNVSGWIDHQENTGFVNTELYRHLVDDEGGYTTPVGAFEEGKSAYGCYDMAGNAYEWTSSEITATNGAERGKTVNDVRGGSWYSTGRSGVSVCTGEGRSPRGAYHSVGFRIAINLPHP